MTEPGADQVPMSSPPGPVSGRSARRKGAAAVSDVCPLLQAPDGEWRSAYASRDHRCWAITPPAQLTLAKQRQLCLTPGHANCATYTAASVGGMDTVAGGTPDRADDSLLWPAVRATPLALEPSRGRTGSLPVAPGRAGDQTLLVALMVLAFLVLVIARTTTPSTRGPSSSRGVAGGAVMSALPSGSVGSPTPTATEPASATPTPSFGPTSSPSASTSSTPAPSNAATSPAAAPSDVRRYTVQKGDTLSGIAAKFGTTVAAIRKANGITDPRLIRIGKVLIIP